MIVEGNLKVLVDLEKEYDQPLDVPAGEPVLNEAHKQNIVYKRGSVEPFMDEGFDEYLDMPPALRKLYRESSIEERMRLKESWIATHPKSAPVEENFLRKLYEEGKNNAS